MLVNIATVLVVALLPQEENIVITIPGATCALGSQIVERVLDRVPADQVAVSVRDPDRAARLTDRGVRVRHGDFTRPASLDHALEGATRVLIVSAAIRGPQGRLANIAAVDAAVRAGAEHVLYTSHQAAGHDSLFDPMRTHAATEDHLAALGVRSTALRHGFYASTVPELLAGDALETGELVAPPTARCSGPPTLTSPRPQPSR